MTTPLSLGIIFNCEQRIIHKNTLFQLFLIKEGAKTMFWDKLKLLFFTLVLIVITSCSTIPNFIEYGTSAPEHNYNYRAIQANVREYLATLSGVTVTNNSQTVTTSRYVVFNFEKQPTSEAQTKANRDGY